MYILLNEVVIIFKVFFIGPLLSDNCHSWYSLNFWCRLHFCDNLCVWGRLPSWGCLHFWGCLYFWGYLYFWGCLRFWVRLHLLGQCWQSYNVSIWCCDYIAESKKKNATKHKKTKKQHKKTTQCKTQSTLKHSTTQEQKVNRQNSHCISERTVAFTQLFWELLESPHHSHNLCGNGHSHKDCRKGKLWQIMCLDQIYKCIRHCSCSHIQKKQKF